MLSIARKKTSLWRVFVLVLSIALVGAIGYYAYTVQYAARPSTPTQQLAMKPQPQATKLESKIMVVGDVYWGRYINDWSMKSDLGVAYPFSRLNEFDRASYDAWVNDMECPITNNPKVSSKQEDDSLQFDCDPKYLPEAKKWFTAMTLANNHTDNQGVEGFEETKRHLQEAGIQHFGTYEPDDHEELCDVIAMPARMTMDDNMTKQIKLPMVWCGYHGVFKTPDEASIAVLSRYAAKLPVVAMPHSGAEYKAEPDTIKTSWHRALIDAGADVVVGDHPHWIQSSEAYKGHLIMYSLGNFIFDQQFNAEVTRSAPLSMTVSVSAKDNPDIEKWARLGEQCASYQDTCVEEAEKQQLKKLVLSYHFSVQGSDNSGKLVHKASPQQLESIKQRLRWEQTIRGLSGKYSGE